MVRLQIADPIPARRRGRSPVVYPGRGHEAGTITLVVLCFAAVIGIALGSYLTLCVRSNQLSSRAVQQEIVRELAQTGFEEALWALNQDDWTGAGPAGTTSWTTSGSSRSATLSYPSAAPGLSGQVEVTIADSLSTGPTWPTITATARLTLPDGEILTRIQRASAGPAPLFGNAIASSESYVSFAASGTVDSWNSDPDNNPATAAAAYSFSPGNPENYSAVVAGHDNGTYGVVLSQAAVYGYVATSGKPVGYATSGFPVGRVVGPATPGALNVDDSRISRSKFVPAGDVFTVETPPTSGPNYGGLINTVLNLVTALLSAGAGVDTYKTSGDLSILGIPLLSPNLVVDRPLKLIVNGDLSISGAGKIVITSTGSLELFVAGDVSIGGGGIQNQTLDPRKMALFCTSSSTSDSLQYTTSSDYCGVIYCENKPIDIRENAVFRGALLSRSYVRFSTNATAPEFHYDTALRNIRFNFVTTPYIIHDLTEL